MNFFDALLHAFSTAGTGGFSNKNSSVAYYDSAYIDGVVTVFMILFGVNFNLYFLLRLRNWKEALKNEGRYLVENSVGIITAICPHIGYQKAADVAKKAIQTGESVRTLILQEGLLEEEELDCILDPENMTEPGISGKELMKKNI